MDGHHDDHTPPANKGVYNNLQKGTTGKIFHMIFTQISYDFHLNWANKVSDRVHMKFGWMELSHEFHMKIMLISCEFQVKLD